MKFVASTLVAALHLFLATAAPGLADTKMVLGIFYYGCEDVCRGVQMEWSESGYEVVLDVRDLEQDVSLLTGLIDGARTGKFDLVITHGTSAILGTIGRLEDAGDATFLSVVPVVFTQVADPFGSRVAESFERSGRENVAVTFNRVHETVNIGVVRGNDPDFKRLGLLYNSNE